MSSFSFPWIPKRNNMKIFITGASGFLGTTLCRFLKDAGHDLITPSSKECDLSDEKSFKPFSQQKYDRIYHLAAWTQAGDFCLRHPGEQWLVNQKMNTNVLSWWKESQPQAKMIAIGTSCCYEPGTPHVEERFMLGMPTESLFTYAMTKRMLLAGLQALSKQYQMKYLFVIPSTLYGPFYHLDGRQMHFIFDLMRKIVDAKRGGPPAILWGDGSQIRELIFVEDFVSALLKLDQLKHNESYNIGAGRGNTIREFASLLCDAIGYDPKLIQYDTTKYVGAIEKVLVIDKIKNDLPDWKLTNLNTGIQKTVDWYLNATG